MWQHYSGSFHPGAQHFRYAPGLRDAAAGIMRFAGVEHFADGADAVVVEMLGETLEKFSRFGFIRMNFQPSVDEWPDQPCPNGALMISAVA